MEHLNIVGAGVHAKVAIEIAELTGYKQITVLDDNPHVQYCGNYKW